jgi:uncharacterized peroxidase-related enzyme
MPFFKSMPADAGPANVFRAYPEVFGHWLKMSQTLMNGPSPFSPGERELIATYVVGLADCKYAYAAHSAATYAWGIEEGLVEAILENPDTAPIEPKFKPLLAFVRKLTLTPNKLAQADADAVFAAGWDERALHDAILVCARMSFMNRLVEGYGFTPMSPERAKADAKLRVAKGYQNKYPEFEEKKS